MGVESLPASDVRGGGGLVDRRDRFRYPRQRLSEYTRNEKLHEVLVRAQ